MTITVMKQAMAALYENTHYSYKGDPHSEQDERNDNVILALRKAIEEAGKWELEQVAWMYLEEFETGEGVQWVDTVSFVRPPPIPGAFRNVTPLFERKAEKTE